MATLSTTHISSHRPGRVRATLASWFAAFARGCVNHMNRMSRVDEVQRLNDMSDAQLAKIGLKRDDIVRHVFRDCYHL